MGKIRSVRRKFTMQIRAISKGLVLVGLGVYLTGCGKATTENQGEAAAPSASPNVDHSMHQNHDGNDDAGHGNGAGNHNGTAHDHGAGMEKEVHPNLAKLSEEDCLSAHQQAVCPVSGEALGSMGVPIKVEVNGQTVWLCCSGCKSKLDANPKEYLAKLHK
jgi:Cu(I)/Ag(I) efflux system membrane fusion protein